MRSFLCLSNTFAWPHIFNLMFAGNNILPGSIISINLLFIFKNYSANIFAVNLHYSFLISMNFIGLVKFVNCDRLCEKGFIAVSDFQVWRVITPNMLNPLSSRDSAILGVNSKQILCCYHTHKSGCRLSSTCNWKSYKTPFRRAGHNYYTAPS